MKCFIIVVIFWLIYKCISLCFSLIFKQVCQLSSFYVLEVNLLRNLTLLAKVMVAGRFLFFIFFFRKFIEKPHAWPTLCYTNVTRFCMYMYIVHLRSFQGQWKKNQPENELKLEYFDVRINEFIEIEPCDFGKIQYY